MSKHEIVSVTAMQVFTWRFHPGIEAVVKTKGGAVGRAVCTAGISIGSHEVKFCYDGGERWGGLGVENAVRAIEEKIAPVLIGMDASDQFAIDQAMLGICPEAKENIGGKPGNPVIPPHRRRQRHLPSGTRSSGGGRPRALRRRCDNTGPKTNLLLHVPWI